MRRSVLPGRSGSFCRGHDTRLVRINLCFLENHCNFPRQNKNVDVITHVSDWYLSCTQAHDINAIFQTLWTYFDKVYPKIFCLRSMCAYFNEIRTSRLIGWCFRLGYIFEHCFSSSWIPNWVMENLTWHTCVFKKSKQRHICWEMASCRIKQIVKFRRMITNIEILVRMRDGCVTTERSFPNSDLAIFANYSQKSSFGFYRKFALSWVWAYKAVLSRMALPATEIANKVKKKELSLSLTWLQLFYQFWLLNWLNE